MTTQTMPGKDTPTSAGDRPSLHMAIVGGGITGLSAAWALQKLAEQGQPVRYTLLEASQRWGGKIRTERVEGAEAQPFIVEAGPDSFITQKPWGLELARELGLEERLLGANDQRRKVYVLNRGRLTPLPDGVLLVVPTRFLPFVTSPLISPLGKLRMALDLVIPARRDGQDETLADFMRRRLGQEALDKLGEPLLSGIYNADAEEQSLLATFPRFRALEEKHGSLIRGMLAAKAQRMHAPKRPGKPVSMFVSFREGMEELPRALAAQLTGDLRLGVAVEGLARREEGGYRLALNDGGRLDVDGVILAIPAGATARLVRPLAPRAAQRLASIRYVSTGAVSLAFSGEQVRPLDGFGVVIPRSEGRRINAITWTSVKFHHRAPAGYELIRVFFGGSRTPATFQLDDQALLAAVREELQEILGITAQPLFQRIARWPQAQPQYDVGHLERVAAIEEALPSGLLVAGSPYRGVGIPDCVRQGRAAAERLLETVKSR